MEFKTLFDDISTAINNRPLGALQDSHQPLTPNHLLLGRNFSPISAQNFVNADSSLLGLKNYVKDVYNTWWLRWESEVLPKLFVPGSKWNKKHDNIKVGDIGILLSTKVLAGKMISIYKYCNSI